MRKYLDANRELWNAWTRIHVQSQSYDVDGFRKGKNTLDSVVRQGVGDVAGKSLLHLQCHFGLDTLSWARLGARVTGADFSNQAIAEARKLSADLAIPAEFVCGNLYDLPQLLNGEFDVVFTSHGVLTWLPDLNEWAKVIAYFLKRGGLFFIAEGHPLAYIFDDENTQDLRVRYPYFHSASPTAFEVKGSYADPENDFRGVEYAWTHSVGDVLNAVTNAGLRVVEFQEYPFLAWKMYPMMEQGTDGWWRMPEGFPALPLMFSLKAIKP